MPTQRIYYEDSHARTFEGVVTACEPGKAGYRIALDRTCFFPEGGGQYGDRGSLCTPSGEIISVADTREREGVIWHSGDKPLPVGSPVTGELDWELRFARMQCHTGEHIVSGLFHRLYGLENVGFHLGDEEMTIDLSGGVTWAQAQEVQRLANRGVAEDVPVSCAVPPPEELARLEYRSKLALTENVRIVTIPGYDVCACCAPHVKRTGEIGLIHLAGIQNWKGGVRIRMLCGSRAVADVMAKQNQISAISALLSAKQEGAAQAVERLSGALETAKHRAAQLGKALAERKAEALPQGERCLLLFETLDTAALRTLVNAALDRDTGLCAAFAPEGDRFQYIIGSGQTDLRPLVKEMNGTLRGRGGGSAQMVQGSVQAGRREIEAWWNTVVNKS